MLRLAALLRRVLGDGSRREQPAAREACGFEFLRSKNSAAMLCSNEGLIEILLRV